MTGQSETLLLIVDVQNDFMPGGSLAVAGGDEIIPVVNKLVRQFDNVALTQDWHPAGHTSFAASHPGKVPYDTILLPYGLQTLWPNHCVQGTAGADFHRDLEATRAQLVIRKGYHPDIDSYSAFLAADGMTATGLAGYMRERGFSHIVIAGLATDFCVAWSALDARRLGFSVTVVEDACRGIDVDGSLAAAWRQFQQAGVERVASTLLD